MKTIGLARSATILLIFPCWVKMLYIHEEALYEASTGLHPYLIYICVLLVFFIPNLLIFLYVLACEKLDEVLNLELK